MQDRFKFRAWNTQTKIMKEVSQISFDDKQIAEYAPKDKVSVHLNFQPHFILMQCTGLRDNNNKLIYEGDIVKIDDEIFVIIYWRGEFTAESIDNAISQEERVHMNWYNFCYPNNTPILPEIIGNIYENPELLEDK